MTSWRLAAVAAVLVVAGCSSGSGAGTESPESAIRSAIDVVSLDDVDGPEQVTSKATSYWTATGRAEGDTASAASDAVAALESDDWAMVDPVAIAGGMAATGVRDGTAIQVAAFERIGSLDPPAGSVWVQIQVADRSADLDWVG